MSASPFHYRYHSDALSGYMGLTLEERGAYTTILDLIYDRGGPIPERERLLAGYLNVSLRKARSVVGSLIAKNKLYRTDDGLLGNKRADEEIAKAVAKRAEHAESGSKGGRKRAENAMKAKRKVFETAEKPKENNTTTQARLKHQPHTTHHEDTNVSSVLADAFDEFWSAVPRKVKKAAAKRAFSKAVKKAAPDTIIAAMRAYAETRVGQDDKYTAHPSSWLNDERWDDAPPQFSAIHGDRHGQRHSKGSRKLDAALAGARAAVGPR